MLADVEQNLWGSVPKCLNIRGQLLNSIWFVTGSISRRSRYQLSCKTEVGEFEHAIFFEEQVAHLEVSVHHLVVMQLKESSDQLEDNQLDLREGEEVA